MAAHPQLDGAVRDRDRYGVSNGVRSAQRKHSSNPLNGKRGGAGGLALHNAGRNRATRNRVVADLAARIRADRKLAVAQLRIVYRCVLLLGACGALATQNPQPDKRRAVDATRGRKSIQNLDDAGVARLCRPRYGVLADGAQTNALGMKT